MLQPVLSLEVSPYDAIAMVINATNDEFIANGTGTQNGNFNVAAQTSG
jgi:hypothetical protein